VREAAASKGDSHLMNPAWASKPSWCIVDLNDGMVPPQYERDTATGR